MITIKKHAGIYTLHTKQKLPIGIEKAWAFFSSPENLEKITPSSMGFKITSGETETMYPGQIITYQVSPFIGYTTNWVTEITAVNEKHYFIDEQRFGPYKMWHHEHWFQETKDGILMTDRVSYKLPFGILGQLAHFLFVQRQLENIFTYRYNYLITQFKLTSHA